MQFLKIRRNEKHVATFFTFKINILGQICFHSHNGLSPLGTSGNLMQRPKL